MATIGPFSKTLFTLCKSRDLPEPIFDTLYSTDGYGATVKFDSGMTKTSSGYTTVEEAKEDVARQALMKLCVRKAGETVPEAVTKDVEPNSEDLSERVIESIEIDDEGDDDIEIISNHNEECNIEDNCVENGNNPISTSAQIEDTFITDGNIVVADVEVGGSYSRDDDDSRETEMCSSTIDSGNYMSDEDCIVLENTEAQQHIDVLKKFASDSVNSWLVDDITETHSEQQILMCEFCHRQCRNEKDLQYYLKRKHFVKFQACYAGIVLHLGLSDPDVKRKGPNKRRAKRAAALAAKKLGSSGEKLIPVENDVRNDIPPDNNVISLVESGAINSTEDGTISPVAKVIHLDSDDEIKSTSQTNHNPIDFEIEDVPAKATSTKEITEVSSSTFPLDKSKGYWKRTFYDRDPHSNNSKIYIKSMYLL